jgi:hypothetical protein
MAVDGLSLGNQIDKQGIVQVLKCIRSLRAGKRYIRKVEMYYIARSNSCEACQSALFLQRKS